MGRLDEAEHAFRRAVELGPDLALPYVNLGKLLEQRGERAKRCPGLRARTGTRPGDRCVRADRAAAIGETTLRSPDGWVRATFDNFAPTFDAHLRSLRDEVPGRLAAMLTPRLAPRARVPGPRMRDWDWWAHRSTAATFA